MIRNPSRGRWLTLGVVLVLAAALVPPVAAQDDEQQPGGRHLAAHRLPGRTRRSRPVPLDVDATLLLQDGQASGSGGCNTFNGTYVLDGTSLTFGDEISTTLMLCEEAVQAVEDAYLAALPEVAGWAISGGVLTLTDDVGTVLLTFEVPSISLTGSQLALLVTTLAGLRTDADALRTELDALRTELLRAQRAAPARPHPGARAGRQPSCRTRWMLSRVATTTLGLPASSRAERDPPRGHPGTHRRPLPAAALGPAQGHPGRGALHAGHEHRGQHRLPPHGRR